jgi:hypothetical protein
MVQISCLSRLSHQAADTSAVQVRQNVPRVSYISLLDIWMLVCMIFVFSCILEFIIVTSYIRSGRKTTGDKVNIKFADNYLFSPD